MLASVHWQYQLTSVCFTCSSSNIHDMAICVCVCVSMKVNVYMCLVTITLRSLTLCAGTRLTKTVSSSSCDTVSPSQMMELIRSTMCMCTFWLWPLLWKQGEEGQRSRMASLHNFIMDVIFHIGSQWCSNVFHLDNFRLSLTTSTQESVIFLVQHAWDWLYWQTAFCRYLGFLTWWISHFRNWLQRSDHTEGGCDLHYSGRWSLLPRFVSQWLLSSTLPGITSLITSHSL